MDKISVIVSGLEYKIKKIVDLQNQTKADNEKYRLEIHDLNNIVENQKITIKELEEKIKVLKVAKTLESGKDNHQTKVKINELVREIDKCIALLNK